MKIKKEFRKTEKISKFLKSVYGDDTYNEKVEII